MTVIAGKTLIGIATCANIRKRTLVFCNNNETMNQWCRSFKNFTTIDEAKLKQLKLEQSNDYNMIGCSVTPHEVLPSTFVQLRTKPKNQRVVLLFVSMLANCAFHDVCHVSVQG